MEADNIAIVRRAVENVWNRGDLDVADHLFADGYINHGGLISDLVRGPEAIKLSVAFFRTAFPRLHVAIEDLTVDGDMVNMRWSANGGTAVRSDATTGSELTGTTLTTLAFGKIVESWTDWDHMQVLRQLQSVSGGSQA